MKTDLSIFKVFQQSEGNFYIAVIHSIGQLFDPSKGDASIDNQTPTEEDKKDTFNEENGQ